uniref:Uncharacterized protein n=1 Tax=Vespula pensylvanica TaxID=30213 RepID=A0A834P057_VESPE|nr:hypothetical protein H0235_008591 [Vespula pensylvanica]
MSSGAIGKIQMILRVDIVCAVRQNFYRVRVASFRGRGEKWGEREGEEGWKETDESLERDGAQGRASEPGFREACCREGERCSYRR